MYPYSLSLTFTADEVSFGALDGIAEVKQAAKFCAHFPSSSKASALPLEGRKRATAAGGGVAWLVK